MKLLLARTLGRILARLAPPPRSVQMAIEEAVMIGICQGKVFLTVQRGAEQCEAQLPPQCAREVASAMMRAADVAEGCGGRASETIQ